MNIIRKTVAALVFTASLATGIAATTGVAGASVASASGARADTTLVCQRLSGAYSLHTANNGFHWARQYLYNSYTGTGSWGGWVSPTQLHRYFSLPTRGTVYVYVQYAYFNGVDWEFAGEWGKVYNARGQFVSYAC